MKYDIARKEYWIEGFAIAVLLIILVKATQECVKHFGTHFGNVTTPIYTFIIGVIMFVILAAVKAHKYAALALSLGIGYAIAEFVLQELKV